MKIFGMFYYKMSSKYTLKHIQLDKLISIRGRMSPNPYQVHGYDIYFTIKK